MVAHHRRQVKHGTDGAGALVAANAIVTHERERRLDQRLIVDHDRIRDIRGQTLGDARLVGLVGNDEGYS
jgi:hypothetical protein